MDVVVLHFENGSTLLRKQIVFFLQYIPFQKGKADGNNKIYYGKRDKRFKMSSAELFIHILYIIPNTAFFSHNNHRPNA